MMKLFFQLFVIQVKVTVWVAQSLNASNSELGQGFKPNAGLIAWKSLKRYQPAILAFQRSTCITNTEVNLRIL